MRVPHLTRLWGLHPEQPLLWIHPADLLAPIDGHHMKLLRQGDYFCFDGTGLKTLIPGQEEAKAGNGTSRWTPWSVLLWKVFDVNGAACPTCGKVMVLRAEVRPPATLCVLASLERSARGPPSESESVARG